MDLQHSKHNGSSASTPGPDAETIQEWLVAKLAERLDIDPSSIDVTESFVYYGLDSAAAVTLSGELEEWLDRRLAPTLVYDYPCIEALAEYLAAPPTAAAAPALLSSTPAIDWQEPIAIVGMSCRFPEADSLEAFWSVLNAGRSAIDEVPTTRWNAQAFFDANPQTPGKMTTRWGGFVANIDQFDPQFFGISPREASRMDPQQRLLLEVTWEALERAAIPADAIAGSETGVFVGIASNEYSRLQLSAPELIDSYAGTGNALSIAANRLSYILDARGPSIAVDTACSSSLVAVHLACQSLRNGESDCAIAGGVNLIITPDLTIAFSKAQMMAADGRCKTFDADADGYVRGEGCGVVVLKRLSDALRDGNPILATIRGSAVNQDGHSNGLTAPNGLAQQNVIRKALKNSGVVPSTIGYVETHGTGTPLGDPIEIEALHTVLGQERAADAPLVVGSVKTNIGHLEAAAGIAGLIKVVLTLHHEVIPAHLNLQTISPYITPFMDRLAFATEQRPWTRGTGLRCAGVSSFGFGGTNAHIIVAEAPQPVRQIAAEPLVDERPLQILTLSAKSETALKEQARRYSAALQSQPGLRLADVCYTANSGRAHFEKRAALIADTTATLAERLAAFANGEQVANAHSGAVHPARRPKIAFLFTGQGSYYPNMGRELYETEPTFRNALNRCDEILRPYLDRSLLSVLYPDAEEPTRLPDATYLQPAIFAVEYALYALWRSWGVEPTAVLGHSLGEYVAACVAGILSLEDSLRLIAERGRLMHDLPAGAMAALFTDEASVRAALNDVGAGVSIAAINGPRNIVIAGDTEAVQTVVETFKAAGITTQLLRVAQAFHSPLVEPAQDAFAAIASQVVYDAPRIPLIANVTGGALEPGQTLNAAYWRSHMREPVQFAASIAALVEQGCTVFLEIGPKPTLTGMGKRCVPKGQGSWIASLKEDSSDWEMLLNSLGALYTCGAHIAWPAVDQHITRRYITLPTYPFQRSRYWFNVETPKMSSQHDTTSTPEPAIDATDALRHAQAATHQAETPSEHAELISYYESLAKRKDVSTEDEETFREYLNFAPFPEVVPGFSWLLAFTDPDTYRSEINLTLQHHTQMRDMLYRGVNFPSIKKVLDVGCGYASDIIALARKHAHLELHGHNISPDQIALGNRRIAKLNLQDRVKLFERDSAQDAYVDRYDLVIGCQVIHHIKDKHSIFANIRKHLNNGGYIVLAEILSNMVSSIDHPESSAYYAPVEHWIEVLSANQLRVVECGDISREIANFLYDPRFEENFAQAALHQDRVTQEHLRGPHMLGELLRKNLAIYGLMMVQKDEHLSPAMLRRANRDKLLNRVYYADMVREINGEEPTYTSTPQVSSAPQTDHGSSAISKERLLATNLQQRVSMTEVYLREQIGAVLELEPDQIDIQQPLNMLGIDSLMALELKNRCERDLEITLPVVVLLKGPSVAELAAYVLEHLPNSDAADAEVPTAERHSQNLLARLDQLSPDEVDTLLTNLLAEQGV